MVTSQDIRIRLSKDQKQRLKNLAEAHGHKTISDFVRSKIFDDDLALHKKINKVIELLEQAEAKGVKKGEHKVL